MTGMPSGDIRTAGDITRLIAGQPQMMDILSAVSSLNLQDCWVGAGFVRNAVWDAIQGLPRQPHCGDGDVDVVHFDRSNLCPECDLAIEARLAVSLPGVPWQVRNQARMHLRNGDMPYADTADAIRHWPETCTAVAVRSDRGRLRLLAPLGISDLVSMTVTPTPAFADKDDVFRARVAEKQWTRRWPDVRITGGASVGARLPGGERRTCDSVGDCAEEGKLLSLFHPCRKQGHAPARTDP
jgi:hypothetical protein